MAAGFALSLGESGTQVAMPCVQRRGHPLLQRTRAPSFSELLLRLMEPSQQPMGEALTVPGSSLGAQMVKNPPAMQETWFPSLSREDPLEKGLATHFCVLAWRIPWTEEPGRQHPRGCRELDVNTHTHTNSPILQRSKLSPQRRHTGLAGVCLWRGCPSRHGGGCCSARWRGPWPCNP